VQNAEAEVDFVIDTFKHLRKRKPRLLREDFCGTGLVAREWVTRHRDNRALAVDLDAEVLQWGAEVAQRSLKPAQHKRIQWLRKNVLSADGQDLDVVLAMNFSYWLLQERSLLRRYFRRVRRALAGDGIFFLDAYGGYDSHREIEESREIDALGGFTYHWEQVSFNPIDHRLHCDIHFSFADGSQLRRAFRYQWRLWTLPEITDLLRECGFEPRIYWQGWDEDGEADGDFQPATSADADAGWICYIAALPES
jgi:SAM-dependent methyltransferase